MSKSKRKICIVTGSRAEYGLLYWLMKGIAQDSELQLQIIATGMHLSPEFGLTYRVIEADGFSIDAKVEMLLSSDTSLGVAKSIGLGVIGMADALDRLRPDMLVVLGDRYEILAAAQAAMVMQIPIAHLAGGDNGSGTYDNIIRHCITKMASLHFVTHTRARNRVIQLGEQPGNVFCFGATSVDNIVKMDLWTKEALEKDLGITLRDMVLLVTFHPLTMDQTSGGDQLDALLQAIDKILSGRDGSIVFTKPNADNGGRALIQKLESYVQHRDNCFLFDSLGQVRYLSLMKLASAVVGNSSSGIYEAPYLRTPTVDVGSRQQGREGPASIVHCEPNKDSIYSAILGALSFSFNDVEMIYGDGNASKLILRKIKEVIDDPMLSIKTFFDAGCDQ